MGHFKVRLYGKFCSPRQAHTLKPPRRVGWWQPQLSIIPEHILILLYERVASHDVGVKPVTNFTISTVSLWACYLYISRTHPLCPKKRRKKRDFYFCNFTSVVMTKNKTIDRELIVPIEMCLQLNKHTSSNTSCVSESL